MTGTFVSDCAKDLDLDSSGFMTPTEGMEAVTSGRVDAFALTAISLGTLVAELTEDDGLREAYNEGLAKITDSRESYEEVVGEYGFTEEERPQGDVTTEQLCDGDLPDAG